MAQVLVSPAEARSFLVKHLHLHAFFPKGADGVRAMLNHLRCVQIDPLNRMGTNHDLVTLARVPSVKRGEMGHLLRGHTFEHWAKERCFIPVSSFPAYARHAPETVWWKTAVRTERVPAEIVEAVLAEVREKGPIKASDLTDRGTVEPLDWSGWKSTSKATSMALDILWTQCRIVVLRDEHQRKVFDIPERALHAPTLSSAVVPSSPTDFIKWAILERVESAGFLCRSSGSFWSTLAEHRDSEALHELIAEGLVEEVQIEGFSRRYLAPKGWRERKFAEYDNEARILGPLDPLLWDRILLQHAFSFEYIWECYKPVDQRRWGYYVCPVLYRDNFLGRLEGDVKNGTFAVRKVWLERKLSGEEETAFRNALQRHADNCGATLVLEASLEHKEEPKAEAKVGLRRSRSADNGFKAKEQRRSSKKQRGEEDDEDEESEQVLEADEESFDVSANKRGTKRKPPTAAKGAKKEPTETKEKPEKKTPRRSKRQNSIA